MTFKDQVVGPAEMSQSGWQQGAAAVQAQEKHWSTSSGHGFPRATPTRRGAVTRSPLDPHLDPHAQPPQAGEGGKAPEASSSHIHEADLDEEVPRKVQKLKPPLSWGRPHHRVWKSSPPSPIPQQKLALSSLGMDVIISVRLGSFQYFLVSGVRREEHVSFTRPPFSIRPASPLLRIRQPP